MTRQLSQRLQRLERDHLPEVPEITRIIIAPAGDPDPLYGVVMQRQADGTWKHHPTDATDAPEG